MSPPNHEERAQEARRLRGLLLERLIDIDGPFYGRLSKCGQRMKLLCDNCGWSRMVETRCKWKCCPVCQRATTAQSAARFAKIARQCQWPLLVTFTCRHKKSDGVAAFREMRKGLVKLRAQAWWKRRVKGGFAAWEVSRLSSRDRKRRKLGRDSGWHFHCHCLLDCKWLFMTLTPPPQHASAKQRASRIKAINEEIAAQWSLTCGRPGSIDVRRVWYDSNGGIDGAIHEVCKYAMTGAQLAESEWDIEPVLWALEKTRMIAGFGSFYRHQDIKRERASCCPCDACSWMGWKPELFSEWRK